MAAIGIKCKKKKVRGGLQKKIQIERIPLIAILDDVVSTWC